MGGGVEEAAVVKEESGEMDEEVSGGVGRRASLSASEVDKLALDGVALGFWVAPALRFCIPELIVDLGVLALAVDLMAPAFVAGALALAAACLRAVVFLEDCFATTLGAMAARASSLIVEREVEVEVEEESEEVRS